ncbi:S-adenosyl-L-methionine-dependent methyltransferase [Lenzites betulinus]|nr:S-adenosyl-L-methionine-dependent methyltransferase [Lenzites betulinus]
MTSNIVASESWRYCNDDVDSDLEEVDESQFPTFFQERRGRLFHTQPTIPYPLPFDTEEQLRQKELHEIIGCLTSSRCAEWLDSHSNEQRRVLDVGTGTGIWVLQMAAQFPQAMFTGLDIAPISTRYPPANVTFQLYDIMLGLPYASSSIDIVHARMITLGVRNYQTFVDEAARVLKPGGLLSTCEWTRSLGLVDRNDVLLRAPQACAFLKVLNDALRAACQFLPTMFDMQTAVGSRDDLRVVQSSFVAIPVGDWPEEQGMKALGVKYRDVLVAYAHSMRTFLEGFHAADVVDGLIDGFIADLHGQNSLVSAYYANHAERI